MSHRCRPDNHVNRNVEGTLQVIEGSGCVRKDVNALLATSCFADRCIIKHWDITVLFNLRDRVAKAFAKFCLGVRLALPTLILVISTISGAIFIATFIAINVHFLLRQAPFRFLARCIHQSVRWYPLFSSGTRI